MALFTSVKPITNEAQNYLDQLYHLLTQCQLHHIDIHLAYLYDTGHKKMILVMDGIEIKEEEKHEEKII